MLPKNWNDEWCRDKAIVILFGKNTVTRYKDGQALSPAEEDAYMPYAVKNVSDLDHVDIMRKSMNYGVAGVEGLENIKNLQERAGIERQLNLITKSPELELELKDRDAKIAELEAKLAAVDVPKEPKAPKDAK